MNVNLLDLLKGQIGSHLIGKAASFLGESSNGATSGLNSILPSILGGLMSQASTPDGAGGIMDMLTSGGHDGGMLDNLGDLFGGGDATTGLVNSGGGIVRSIFGNKLGGVIDMITSASGMSRSSSTSMISMLAPIVMGMIGRQKKEHNLDASGLAQMLMGQKDHIASAVPSGFAEHLGFGSFDDLETKSKSSWGSLWSSATGAAGAGADYVKDTGSRVAEGGQEAAAAGGGMLKKLLPLLLLLGLGILLFPMLRGCGGEAADKMGDAAGTLKNKTTNVVKATGDAAKGAAKATGDAAKGAANAAGNAAKGAGNAVGDAAKGAANAAGNAASAAGNAVKGVMGAIKLPGGKELKVLQGSAEEKFANFLGKGGKAGGKEIFNFNDLTFATGSANLDAASQSRVKNLAAVLQAYPKTKIRLDGHTDNTGDATKNRTLSKQRADAVKALLTKAGINAGRIATRGLGDTKPVAPNNTPQGKAKNRRIELRVVK